MRRVLFFGFVLPDVMMQRCRERPCDDSKCGLCCVDVKSCGSFVSGSHIRTHTRARTHAPSSLQLRRMFAALLPSSLAAAINIQHTHTHTHTHNKPIIIQLVLNISLTRINATVWTGTFLQRRSVKTKAACLPSAWTESVS